MYGIPASFDPSRLVGCVLELISFSENTVQLVFSNNVSITVESCFRYMTEEVSFPMGLTYIPVRESNLMQLLGVEVTSAAVKTSSTLSLKFGNGHILELVDDRVEYEAFRIQIGTNEIVV